MEVISRDDFYSLAPKMSKEIEWEDEVVPVVDVIMQMEIKQQLGNFKYMEIVKWLETGDGIECLEVLWNGGKYEDSCGETGIIDGMKKAVVYYVYAHLIKRGNSYFAQTGYRQFNDEYTILTSDKMTESNYQYYKSIADSYMADCFQYIRTCKSLNKCSTEKNLRSKKIYVIKSE